MGAAPLLDRIQSGDLNTNDASAGDVIATTSSARGAQVVISQPARRAKPLRVYRSLYKLPRVIENCFCRREENKRMAVRAKTMLYHDADI